MIFRLTLCAAILLLPCKLYAQEDKIELETTIIKGNKELPKILYVVPWQDRKKSQEQAQQLQLHSLFGDLFDPVLPDDVKLKNEQPLEGS